MTNGPQAATQAMQLINVNSHWWARVALDGKEVSQRCFRAYVPMDPGTEGDGWVDLYDVDETGTRFVLANPDNPEAGPAWQRQYGRVCWWPMPEVAEAPKAVGSG